MEKEYFGTELDLNEFELPWMYVDNVWVFAGAHLHVASKKPSASSTFYPIYSMMPQK